MRAHVAPSICNGHAVIPSSKSMVYRAIICVSLASGTSVMKNVTYPQDTKTMIAGMQQLGADIRMEANQVVVTGTKDFTIKSREVFCCESGSTLRFLIPVFSFCNQGITLIDQDRLLQRPQKVYEDSLHVQGFTFRQDASGIMIHGCLKPGGIILQDDVSSQFISGLPFILLLLQEDSTIHILPPLELRSYVDLIL